jgi:hypothetical protein
MDIVERLNYVTDRDRISDAQEEIKKNRDRTPHPAVVDGHAVVWSYDFRAYLI